MDTNDGGSEQIGSGETLSAEERAKLVGEWKKNRADLSWKPLEGRELDVLLPVKNRLMTGFVAAVFIAGALLVALALSVQSAPPAPEEVTATVMAAGKPNSDGYATVIVAIPGEDVVTVPYRGSAKLRQGQRVVLETRTVPLIQRKSYRFKDPPDDE